MLTLLQINSVVNTGSTGRIAEQLGNMAISKGWKSYIAYGREARTSKSQLIRIGSVISLYIHVCLSRFLGTHGLHSRIATSRLIKKIKRIKPDVVHIHNLHGYYVNYPKLLTFLREERIPTIITLHDFWLLTGHCAYINASCERWKTGCGKCPRLGQYPSSKADSSMRNWEIKSQLFNEMPNIILVPVSQWLNKYVKQSLLSSQRSCVIYNGIDTDVFKPYLGKTRIDDNIALAVPAVAVVGYRP